MLLGSHHSWLVCQVSHVGIQWVRRLRPRQEAFSVTASWAGFPPCFQSAQDADVQADDEANSFHYHCNKKRRQALEFWADQPRSSEVLLTALLSTEPLDKLSARLQMLDEAGNAMTEFVDPTPRGLLHKCLRHLSDLLTPFVHGADNDHAPKLEASVRHLEQWFAPGFNRSTYFNSMRSAILSISSSVLRKRTFTPLHFPQQIAFINVSSKNNHQCNSSFPSPEVTPCG